MRQPPASGTYPTVHAYNKSCEGMLTTDQRGIPSVGWVGAGLACHKSFDSKALRFGMINAL